MSRQKNRRNRTKNQHEVKEIASQCIQSPECTGDLMEDLLFHPVISKSSGRHENSLDFDYISVPFMIEDDLVFMLTFLDSCGDMSVYVKCYEMDTTKPSTSFRDAMVLMKKCLEVEQTTGTQFYFGKLDKALEKYLYAMQLFVDKGILEKEKALEIIKGFDVIADDMEQASQSVNRSIIESQLREERMRGEAKASTAAGELLMHFIMNVLDSGTKTDDNPLQKPAEEKDDEKD